MVYSRQTDQSPLFSIITVVLNGEKYLEQTIKSVVGQNFSNFEYLIIDGGSTDGTLDIIKKYESQIDHWISEPDNGIYDAMNKGLRLAKGEVVNFLNCGDFYLNNKVLELIAHKFQNSRVDFVTTRAVMVDLNGKAIHRGKREIVSSLVATKLKSVSHQAIFYKKSLHGKFGKYSEDLKILADTKFILKLFKNKIPFDSVDKKLIACRTGGVSSDPKAALERKKVYDEIFGKDIFNYLLYLKYFLRKTYLGRVFFEQYLKLKDLFIC